MTVKSFNNTLVDLASGDLISPTQKSNLLTQYNSNISGIQNQLGYKPTYGTTTNPNQSALQVINSAYDTSGNGGRKLVRTKNGDLYAVVKISTTSYSIYKYTVSGGTWALFVNQALSNLTDVALTTNGTNIYLIATYNSGNVAYYSYNSSGTSLGTVVIDSSQTAVGNCSVAFSPTDNKLKAVWVSKNSTYSSSFNLRYAEGTIANDGSVSWGAVTQLTTYNNVGIDAKNPSIVIRNGLPVILHDYTSGVPAYNIHSYVYNGTTWTKYDVFPNSVYTQSSPSATVDGNGVIHAVWWGTDATDSTQSNIRYSKSTDGGVTWSAMTKLTSGNTYGQGSASITCDQNNNIYIYWEGITATSAGKTNIRSIVYNGTWGIITEVTNQSTNNMRYVSLCDNLRTFTSPLVIWQDNVTPSVKFSGTWTDTPIIAETVTTSAVSNKELIDKVIAKGIGARMLQGTVTSSGSTSAFTMVSGTTANLPSITVTGLPFKPIFIYAFYVNGALTKNTIYSEISGDQYPKTAKIQSVNNASSTPSTYHIKGDVAPSSITNGTFTLPTEQAGGTYTWIAIG